MAFYDGVTEIKGHDVCTVSVTGRSGMELDDDECGWLMMFGTGWKDANGEKLHDDNGLDRTGVGYNNNNSGREGRRWLAL